MTAIAISADIPFARTRFTWLGYALMAYFAFALSLLGPIMPFLADKMGLTFTQMGYHFTLMAAGIVLISLIGDKIARRIGNNQLVWTGTMLIGIALPGVTSGSSLAITLPSMFLYGFGIGAVALTATAMIANSARQHSAKAYTEGNIVAGIAMILGPVLVGFIARSTLGWQAVSFLPLISLGLIIVIFPGLPLPAAPEKEALLESAEVSENSPLPRLFWVFGVLMFLAVAIEWLITSWGASFLTSAVGFEQSTAAALLSVFAVAIVVGRLIGRRLLEFMTESRLLILSLVWVLLAFPIYWLSMLPLLNVAGLFLIGLGVGNLAPLSVSGAMTAAGDATNRASARLVMFPSLATLTMVQFFGILADRYGIQYAYVLMVAVVIVAIAVAASTARLRRAIA